MTNIIPIIDVFAGPGGLGEGFSRYCGYFGDGSIQFRVRLSIEKDAVAARTLKLRAFVRAFEEGKLPAAYYDYIKAATPEARQRAMEQIQATAEWVEAGKEAWNATLGKVDFFDLHQRIRSRLGGQELWVLLGGPPCQAYSVVGRSRRMGIGQETRKRPENEWQTEAEKRAHAFFRDDTHMLYREYLKIVALHQPPFFVMENVKGILSSRIEGVGAGGEREHKKVFEQILADLEDPWAALKDETWPEGAEALFPPQQHGYFIHSFVELPDRVTSSYRHDDYLIRCEDYGVPQERHRVILLGIRDDLDLVPHPIEAVPAKSRTTLSQVLGDLPKVRSGRSGRKTHKERGDRMDTPGRWLQAVKDSVTAGMRQEIGARDNRILKEMENLLSLAETELTRGAQFVPGRAWSQGDSLLKSWYHDERLEGFLQHETRDHMDADFARYLFVAAYGVVNKDSPKLRHFPASLLPDHQNAQTEEGRRIFHDRFRVQLADKTATTITSHIRKDGHYFIHYDPKQCRSLTVREAARVQTFPDNYYFEGSRTEQYEQVGNAVPPLLAAQLARVVASLIGELLPDRTHRKKLYTEASLA